MLKVHQSKSVAFAVKIIEQIAENGQHVALQEAVIVARDIFRRFPNKYEKLVKCCVDKVAIFTEPDAKAAIAWIVGEHAPKIPEVPRLFEEHFVGSFLEDPHSVQLQILTAAVKLFLQLPDECEEMIQRVLSLATEQVANPDIKDRAYIYWRMLSTSPQKTQDVVLGKKPNVASDTYNLMESDLVDKLISGIGGLSSLYHKTPGEWTKEQQKYAPKTAAAEPAPAEPAPQEEKKKAKREKKVVEKEPSEEDAQTPEPPLEPEPVVHQQSEMNLDDLLGMDTSSTSAPVNNMAGGGLSGLDFGGVSQPAVQS